MQTKGKFLGMGLRSVVLLALPAVAHAQFLYLIINGAMTITGYTGTNSNVIIPATIAGLPVTSIGSFFSFSTTSPTNITIPASVTNIASEAFAYEASLTAIMVDPQNSLYSSSNGILFDKPQIVLIQAPGRMAGGYAIPDSVTTIGDGAFMFCTGLSGITIPDSVTNIGSQAFYDCASLTNVAIGPNVLNLGSGAFAECQNLTAITVDEKNLFYRSTCGVLFDKPQWTLIQAPGGMAGSYAIPAGVTNIGAEAFANCANLTVITMPPSVTDIGGQAFYGCAGLTNLTLGADVLSLGDYAFSDCWGLTNFTIPNQVTSIGDGAFEYCGSLANITVGTNVASIGDDAFESCSSLAALSIPNSVTNIGSSALANCGSLTNIALGTNVASIGDDAFQNCARLTDVLIPASVTNLGNTVFAGCENLAAIGVDEQNLYYSSSGGVLFNQPQTTLIQVPGEFVGSFAVPDSVTNISAGALADCGRLTAITVGGKNNYFTATNGVLFDKQQTTLIQFPGGLGGGYTVADGITRLGGTAFSGCSHLTSITIPTSVTNVGNATFDGCSYAAIYFEGNAPGITSPGLITFGQILPIFGNDFYNPNAEAVYYLPGTLGWSANFEGLPAYLWVPPYVCTPASNSIMINGFNGSGGAIILPDTIEGQPVTAIASGLFDNAAGFGLTNIVLGANVTTIGNYAFAACANLTSITIPQGVTNLGSGAFAFCDSLKSVYFQGNAPSANSGVFFQWSGYPFFPPVYEPPTPTTVYYLPGSTGWGTTFDGQPTVLWNPQAQTSDASFGVRNNRFGFNIIGASNLIVVVEASTNLFGPDWQPAQTVTLTTGTAYFSDPQWTNYPGRYYRLRSP